MDEASAAAYRQAQPLVCAFSDKLNLSSTANIRTGRHESTEWPYQLREGGCCHYPATLDGRLFASHRFIYTVPLPLESPAAVDIHGVLDNLQIGGVWLRGVVQIFLASWRRNSCRFLVRLAVPIAAAAASEINVVLCCMTACHCGDVRRLFG